MIRAAIHGRLGADPIERQTRTGNSMTTASIAVDAGRGDETATEWFNVVAFGKAAELLAQHMKGDLLDLHGQLYRNSFTGKDGVERTNWSTTVESIISARRPPSGKRLPVAPYAAQQRPLRGLPPAAPVADDRVNDLWDVAP